MRRLALTLLALAAGTTFAFADWAEAPHPDLGFAASFPTPPKLTDKESDGLMFHYVSANTEDGSIFCLVAVSDEVKSGTAAPDMEALATTYQGAATARREVELTRPGSNMHAEAKLKAVELDSGTEATVSRALVTTEGPRYYLVLGIAQKSDKAEADVAHCIGGFKLLPE